MLTILLVGNRYQIETVNGRIHVLTLEALKWNLKKVFGFTGVEVQAIISELDASGKVTFDSETLEKAA